MFLGFSMSLYVILYPRLSLYIIVYPCVYILIYLIWWLLVRPPEKDALHVVPLPSPVATQVLSAQQLKDRLLQEIDLDELEEGLDPEDRQFLGFDDALDKYG